MDRNVIQAPELLRRLTRRLGVREAHITPTLNEGIQGVVIVDDLRNPDTIGGDTQDPVTLGFGTIMPITALNEIGFQFFNSSLTKRYRVKRLEVRASVTTPFVVGWRDTQLVAPTVSLTVLNRGKAQSMVASSDLGLSTIGPNAASTSYITRGFHHTLVPAAAPLVFVETDNIIIGPGCGLIVQTFNAGTAGNAWVNLIAAEETA